MGLDMYLYGRKDNYHLVDYNIGRIGVQVELGYWRKVNCVHQWFVDNVQDGVDNCATYYVSRETLEELKDVCQKVLDNPDRAEELLPNKEGFFFGSQEYDEWYFNDIQETIDIINKALKLDYDYYEYHSSW